MAAGVRSPVLLALVLSWLAFTHGARADFNMLGGNILNQKGVALGVGFANADTGDLTLDPALRMGVLTQTPSANLHVAGNLLVTDYIVMAQASLEPTVPAGYAALYVLSGNICYKDASGASAISSGGGGAWSSSAGNIYYTSGSVGLGTSTPSANLHVMGNMQASDQVLLGDGSAASPALSFVNDLDSGLYLGASSNLVLVVDGAPKLSIYSGNVSMHNLDLRTDRWLHTDENTFVGVGVAGAGNLSHTTGMEGWYNTGAGFQALFSCNTGFANTALGARALYSVTSGNMNTAIGFQALYSCTTGANNTAVGSNCLYRNLGSFNSACGASAMYENTTGEYNTAFGAFAMQRNTTGSYNSAGGYLALSAKAGVGGTGNHNTALGSMSLYSLDSGSYNSALGQQALFSCTSGSENTALGRHAGFSLTTGVNNVLLGSRAGYSLTSGSNNILIGAQAGFSLSTGCNNIVIGRNQDVPSAASSDRLNIGGVIFGDLLAGKIGLGTATPAGNLHVNGNVVVGDVLPSGNATCDLGSLALGWDSVYAVDVYLTSDRRRKSGVRPLEYGLGELLRLEPVGYHWRDTGEQAIGFIAQDVEAVIPEAVETGNGPEATKALRCGALLPVLVRAVQEEDAQAREVLAACRKRLSEARELNARIRAELRDLDDGRRE